MNETRGFLQEQAERWGIDLQLVSSAGARGTGGMMAEILKVLSVQKALPCADFV